jgi:hypothetical protein
MNVLAGALVCVRFLVEDRPPSRVSRVKPIGVYPLFGFQPPATGVFQNPLSFPTLGRQMIK